MKAFTKTLILLAAMTACGSNSVAAQTAAAHSEANRMHGDKQIMAPEAFYENPAEMGRSPEKGKAALPSKPAARHKSADWYEPDTLYYVYEQDEYRKLYTYTDGKCTLNLFLVWKSGQWENFQKDIYEYDAQGNITSEVYQSWDPGQSQWETFFKITHTYDSQGNITEIRAQAYQSGEVTEEEQYTYTYDSQNNMTSEEIRYYNGGYMYSSAKVTFEYDSQNNVTLKLVQNWESDQWKNLFKVFYTYDLQHNMTSSLSQDWISGQWENNRKYTYEYNSQNSMTSRLSQSWRSYFWENYQKNTWEYDSQNNMTLELLQQWESDQWKNYQQFTHEYDGQNNKTSVLCQDWMSSDQWENFRKYTYTYDEYNNAAAGFVKKWENNMWIDDNATCEIFYNNMQSMTTQYCTHFTASYAKTEEALAVAGLTPAQGAVDVSLDAEVSVTFSRDITAEDLSGITLNGVAANASVSGNRVIINHADFNPDTFYTVNVPAGAVNGYGEAISWTFTTDAGTGIAETDNYPSLRVYPNPTSGQLTITMGHAPLSNIVENVAVYDMTGRVVGANLRVRPMNGEMAIDISHLPSGVYFLRMQTDKGIVTEKIVKE